MGRGYNPYPDKATLRSLAKDRRKPYRHVRCDAALSFPDTLMEDETLMHVHWGEVQYTATCQVMDAVVGERYRIHVEFNGDLKKVSLHKLIRKTNTGVYGVRMCHKNPKWEFKEKHFYPGSY